LEAMDLKLTLIFHFSLKKFLCGGRLIFGPDASSLYLSTILILGPAVMFFVKMYTKMADPRTKNPNLCIPILCVSWILTILVCLLLSNFF